jgi:hypothetical protein
MQDAIGIRVRCDKFCIIQLDREVVFERNNRGESFGVLKLDTPLAPCISLVVIFVQLLTFLLPSLAFVFGHGLWISVLQG